ncbi:MAG: hypothetical protein GEU83_11860 [Pseudonocardiaceae bacterium]|nr:hypothetical protein [Pseudonocardiaceae bacterium]
MAFATVTLHGSGVRDLLRSPGVLGDLERRARAIADRAGPGHDVESEVGANRARAVVYTVTFDAMLAEAHQRTLTRAIDAGR